MLDHELSISAIKKGRVQDPMAYPTESFVVVTVFDAASHNF